MPISICVSTSSSSSLFSGEVPSSTNQHQQQAESQHSSIVQHLMDTESSPQDHTAGPNQNSKPKIVVVMGATGAGKSKLAIDLASQFSIEIINADSMQVYQGLDILTNKVPMKDQKGVPHHLLGTIAPNVEFTAKDFRDSAIQLIDEIRSRNCLPVIVGGTNYYIQALVTQFLLDDYADDLEENCSWDLPEDNKKPEPELEPMSEDSDFTYSRLKELDPVAANRIHPNDCRKIKQYLSLYSRFGVLPSKIFQDKIMKNWGRADNLRYDCCFICVDASLPELDRYVEQRVDLMVDSGLLREVCDIYKSNADYTRGLRQAIGVREFEDFLKYYWKSERQEPTNELDVHQIMKSFTEDQPKVLMLKEATEKVKLNTRRLLRRQRRRLSRLQMMYGWDIHYIDVTSCISCASEKLWNANVVEPSVKIIKSFLDKQSANSEEGRKSCDEEIKLEPQRDFWTLYICQACSNKELRGAHEWEQHKQGKGHRKRVCRLRKSGILSQKNRLD